MGQGTSQPQPWHAWCRGRTPGPPAFCIAGWAKPEQDKGLGPPRAKPGTPWGRRGWAWLPSRGRKKRVQRWRKAPTAVSLIESATGIYNMISLLPISIPLTSLIPAHPSTQPRGFPGNGWNANKNRALLLFDWLSNLMRCGSSTSCKPNKEWQVLTNIKPNEQSLASTNCKLNKNSEARAVTNTTCSASEVRKLPGNALRAHSGFLVGLQTPCGFIVGCLGVPFLLPCLSFPSPLLPSFSVSFSFPFFSFDPRSSLLFPFSPL